ncbi:MAG: AraC family transcriptional regulator [Lachnospiraceae bacterium]|nr:AraC family transcriptional regulator [Lachnospiraceae bacterium]
MFISHYPIIAHENRLPLYLISLGMHDCQPPVKRGTEYGFPQIFYCTKGRGMLCYDGIKTEIKAGMGFFIPASYPHDYHPIGNVWDNHWLIPGGYAHDRLLSDIGFDAPITFTPDSTAQLDKLFMNMHTALQRDNIYGNLKASGILYEFLIELDRAINHLNNSVGPNPALQKCLKLIDTAYPGPVTMEDLCAVSGISKQHICRLFRSSLGTRPMEYIAKRRIQAAKELVSGTRMTIDEIADKTGFCSSSYFCKLFKRYEDITPTQFRNS